MRRLLAILLLAAFGLPTAAPLLAQGQDLDRNLPACCRRNGTHHCGMSTPQNSNTPTVTALCPSFPQQNAVAPHLTLTALPATQPGIKLPLLIESTPASLEAQRHISRERTHQTRGPPPDTSL